MIQSTMWKDIDTLRRDMEGFFSGFSALSGANGANGIGDRVPAMANLSRLFGGPESQYPALHLHEDEDALYVEAALPGVAPESLNVSVESDILTISGEKSRFTGDIESETFHRKERVAGAFSREVSLPVEVDADRVTAAYRNGVLVVTLPRSEKAKPRQVSVVAA